MKHWQNVSKRPASRIEAIDMAIKMVGYPCPCGKCYADGGVAKSKEVFDLACDLMGLTYEEVKSRSDYCELLV